MPDGCPCEGRHGLEQPLTLHNADGKGESVATNEAEGESDV